MRIEITMSLQDEFSALAERLQKQVDAENEQRKQFDDLIRPAMKGEPRPPHWVILSHSDNSFEKVFNSKFHPLTFRPSW